MSSLVKTRIAALLLGAAIASGPLTASAEEGPRPSSYGNWSGMMNATGPSSEPTVTPFDGTRPSSLEQWHGITGAAGPNASSTDPSFDGPRPSPNH